MSGLDDMYLFKQVVDHGGLSAAARTLGIPKSTVARRITELETRLGNVLFLRDTKTFVLSNFGAICYEQCTTIAREVDGLLDLADRYRARPTGLLHVICPPVIGGLVIEKLAVEFAVASPQVRLHLEETTGIYDPRTVNADLIIYATSMPLRDATIVARRLATAPYGLVARPDVVAGRPIATPEDLRGCPLIGMAQRRTESQWQLTRDKEMETIRFDPVYSASVPSAVLHAVRAGLGIAALPDALCGAEVTTGSLVRVLPDWSPHPVEIYALYPNGRALTIAARQFVDLLSERLPALMAAGKFA